MDPEIARQLYQRLQSGGTQPPSPLGFQKWYATLSSANGLDPNPYNPLHFYDYMRAYLSGAPPVAGHLPSTYKSIGHPRLIINGIDTRTGQPASPLLIAANRNAYQTTLSAADALGL